MSGCQVVPVLVRVLIRRIPFVVFPTLVKPTNCSGVAVGERGRVWNVSQNHIDCLVRHRTETLTL